MEGFVKGQDSLYLMSTMNRGGVVSKVAQINPIFRVVLDKILPTWIVKRFSQAMARERRKVRLESVLVSVWIHVW